MNDFRKVERALMTGGVILFFTALFFSVFEADRFMLWLGYSSSSHLQPIGKLELRKNMVRRRFQNGSEFLPIQEQQTVFSRDTVMTGSDSGLVIVMSDGTLLELGPDSLIDIKLKDETAGLSNSEFVVTVKKGVVTGTAPAAATTQSVTLVQENKVVPLPTAAPQSLAAQVVAEPQAKKVVARACQIQNLAAISPFLMRDQKARIRGDIFCEGFQNSFILNVADEEGKKVEERKLDLQVGQLTPFEVIVSRPGTYRVGNLMMGVPFRYSGITWRSPPISCEHRLAYEVPKSINSSRSEILVSINGSEPVTESQWMREASMPAKISVILSIPGPFRMESEEKQMIEWRECPSLSFPPHKARITQVSGRPQVFSWAQAQGSQYQFEVAQDLQFTQMVKTEVTSRNFALYRSPQKGLFYWRVRILKTGEVSDPSSFEIR